MTPSNQQVLYNNCMLPTPKIVFAFNNLRTAAALLGVSANASKAEIKTAYYTLAKATHPDNNPHPEAPARFHAITQAYELLLSKHTPSQQQHPHPHPQQQKTKTNEDRDPPNDPFQQQIFSAYQQFKREKQFKGNNFRHFQEFFTSYYQQSKRYHPRQGQSPFRSHDEHEEEEDEEEEEDDETVVQNNKPSSYKKLEINIQIQLNPSEANNGTQKSIKVERRIICTSCQGKPTFKQVKCPKCAGTGLYGRKDDQGICRNCRGHKTIKKSNCEDCKGKGHLDRSFEELIYLKPGITNNQTLVISGKGHQHLKRGFFGNLNIQIRIVGNQAEGAFKFRQNGYNTYATVQISLVQAVLGTSLKYNTVRGERTINLQGGCQNGDLIKRAGEGLKKSSKKENGDHFITLQVKIPQNLSEDQYKIYEKLKELMSQKAKKTSG